MSYLDDIVAQAKTNTLDRQRVAQRDQLSREARRDHPAPWMVFARRVAGLFRRRNNHGRAASGSRDTGRVATGSRRS
jgi:hypothetical protein